MHLEEICFVRSYATRCSKTNTDATRSDHVAVVLEKTPCSTTSFKRSDTHGVDEEEVLVLCKEIVRNVLALAGPIDTMTLLRAFFHYILRNMVGLAESTLSPDTLFLVYV